MDKISLTEILSECQKMLETVDEFVAEISTRNIPDSTILKYIKYI